MTAVRLPELILPMTVDAVRDVMADAHASHVPLSIAGSSSWLHAGSPVQATRTLTLRQLSGITEYVPGDLTITARAGTTMAELAQATAAHGQWLGLDPAGVREGTIGATIATASYGPLAHAFGTPRDLVLGLELVTGYGEIVRPGGRVVKNVAGFDLVRLFTGSWGTLGALTAVTLRLRALPVHDVTLAMPVRETSQLSLLLPALRANTVSLLACEWLDGVTASRLGVGSSDDVILLRIGGNDRFVRGQRAVLESIAPCRSVDPATWGAIAALDAAATAVVRFSGAISDLASRMVRLRASLSAAGATASLQASLGRGIVRVIVTDGVAQCRAVLQTTTPGETRIVERLPEPWWTTEPDPFASGLAGRIRTAFDPHLVCNRRRAADA